ncbi:type II toxin-antitoxin system Phd/YefM family antitoxin [Lentzea californiensis]|uniref:type II toxin-antitoxin system Phd/YefM family antitoxin n=1 Tax=Lentzea californiensis TaxID=438851 RepID=UPI0021641BAA|nr:type II toxin-antitoxin system Phd/YefM family antitoxin [Lentzea californiensis]MCR3746885.1 prevent-host-death family protein [Lentzea californiensis]
MIRIPLASARNQLSDLVAQVESNHERITLTKHGVDAAVLIAPAELEGLEETIEILSRGDNQSEVLNAIRQAEEDLAQGKIANIDELIESLKRRA